MVATGESWTTTWAVRVGRRPVPVGPVQPGPTTRVRHVPGCGRNQEQMSGTLCRSRTPVTAIR
ncbi:hypothetical protein ACIQMO_03550 [Streptomyces sp. NPDC091406]|uniref:hypothetical protein n=1 Tax=unclassified Streptomyces TaxID=2593676 RepID=UPI003813B09B